MSEHPGLILKALYNRCPAVSRRLALSAAARNGTGHSGAQFNVNRVLGARIALGFVLMLTTGNIEDLLVIHQFPEGDIVQEAGQALAQVAPQRVSQAFIAALTAALALATGGVNRFVHGANDFADGDTAGIFT